MTQAWYPFYWSDYSGKTMHLTQGQHGAYLMFMRWIYTTEKPIPDKQRYSIARALLEHEQSNADEVLAEFFIREGENWHSSKCESVIKEANEKHSKRVSAGKIGGISKSSNARAMLYQPQPQPQPQSSKEDIIRPDGLSAQTWADLKSHRKAKKSPLTQTALNGIIREAEKAGLTIEQAVEQMLARGWTGFNATWMKKDENNGRAISGTSNNGGTQSTEGSGFGGRKSQTQLYHEASERIIAERTARAAIAEQTAIAKPIDALAIADLRPAQEVR